MPVKVALLHPTATGSAMIQIEPKEESSPSQWTGMGHQKRAEFLCEIACFALRLTF